MIRAIILSAMLLVSAEAAQVPEQVDLLLTDDPLVELLERLARACDASLAVHAEAVGPCARTATVEADDIAWDAALAWLERSHGLRLTLVDDRLEVEDATAAYGRRAELRYYDVRILLRGRLEYPAPGLGVATDDGPAIDSFMIEDDVPTELEEITELIYGTVAPDTWGRTGIAIDEVDGLLAITQVPEVHARIATLLRDLEIAGGRMLIARLWRLGERAAAMAPVLAGEAWRELERPQQPAATVVLMPDRRNHHYSGIHRLVVKDIDQVGGTGDPIIGYDAEGLAIDIRARATEPGIWATVSFAATHAGDTTAVPALTAAGTRLGELHTTSQTGGYGGNAVLVPREGAALLQCGDEVWAIAFEEVAPAE